jgi:hypothetical protein
MPHITPVRWCTFRHNMHRVLAFASGGHIADSRGAAKDRNPFSPLQRVEPTNLATRAAEREAGVSEDAQTPPLSWSRFSLGKEFNAAKSDAAPWWQEGRCTPSDR